jgi:hypothetical protein
MAGTRSFGWKISTIHAAIATMHGINNWRFGGGDMTGLALGRFLMGRSTAAIAVVDDTKR